MKISTFVARALCGAMFAAFIVAVDVPVIAAPGNILISDATSKQVLELSPAGEVLSVFAAPGGSTSDIAFDTRGNVFLNSSLGGVHKFSPGGAPLGVFATGYSITGIALDADDRLYVADYYGANAPEANGGVILRYSPTGGYLGVFAATSTYLTPQGITFDADGNLIVANAWAGEFCKFSPTGEDLGDFNQPHSGILNPTYIAFNNSGHFFAAPLGLPRIYEYDSQGAKLGVFATGVSANGRGFAFDALDNLLAVSGNKILKFDAAGNALGILATLPSTFELLDIAIMPSPALPGDVNYDGIVNGQDISLVASNWMHDEAGVEGDANRDGIVNGQDIAMIASHWLSSANPTDARAVPEPWTIALAGTGAATLLLLRSRRACLHLRATSPLGALE